MRRDFYVYVWYRAGGVPCYVGKGHGNRARQHAIGSHNVWLMRIFRSERSEMRHEIVARGLTESEAFTLERQLIAKFGRRIHGGTLVNMTDGGEGVSGLVHSDETKLRNGQLSLQMWANPENRERIIAAQNTGRATPEYRERRRELSRAIANDPKVRARISETNRKRYTDPAERQKTSETTRLAMARLEVKPR